MAVSFAKVGRTTKKWTGKEEVFKKKKTLIWILSTALACPNSILISFMYLPVFYIPQVIQENLASPSSQELA